MSSNGDAQQWVWPPAGIEVPPVASTSDFGPVHFGDSMVLEWTSGTQPKIVFACFSQRGNETGLIISQNQKSPATYVMTDTAISQGANDLTFCHYYFTPSDHGNSVVFQFDNRPQAKPFTWSRDSIASASSSSSSTTSTSTSTSSSTVSSSSITAPTSTSSQAASNDNNGGGGGLSAGASAGIGIGVAVAVIIAVIAIFLLIRRRKKNKEMAAMDPQQNHYQGQYQVPPDQYHQQQEQMGSPPSDDQTISYFSNYQGYPDPTYQDTAYEKSASPRPHPAELHSPYRPTELPS